MHTAFIIEATIDTYDLMISIGMVIVSIFVYKTTCVSDNKWLRWIGCIIMAGSVSNCIDEFSTNNTSKSFLEVITWLILCAILIKSQCRNKKL